ncbi:MAG: hypothetical protein KatS3mg129_0869 [Leptospiraceae bacterium]|nr:MAG: hypothetical protein KatS3mg129_0869 [Leptospiraceae bacterium]
MLIPNKYLQKFILIKQNDNYNIIFQNQKIHSLYIEKEIERIINRIPSDIKNILFIGAGNGKILEYIKQKRKDLNIYIFEPIKNFEFFQKILINQKFQYIYSYKELAFIPQFNISIYPVYNRLFPALIDKILTFLQNDINKKTFYKFLYFWIINYKKNLENKYINFIADININKDKILFCGSGITLIEDLKKYNLNEFFIIASDSAVMPLVKNNIKIDIIISIDPNIGTLYHFYSYKDKIKDIPVLTWLGSRKEISYIFDNRFYFLTSFPLDQYLLQLNNSILNLNIPANDVLIYAKAIAQIYNKPFYLAGCGIKNSVKFYYTSQTGYDYYSILKQNRIFSSEFYHFKLFKNQSYKRKNSQNSIFENIINSYKELNNHTTKYLTIETKFIKDIYKRNINIILDKYPYFELFFQIL